MTNNKKDIQKNAFNDLFNTTSIDSVPSPVIEESITTISSIEEKKEERDTTTKRKTYNLPTDIVEDMEKIVYMDRDIKDNTDLLIKALRQYLDSKYCKDLLNEYNILKGGKNNE